MQDDESDTKKLVVRECDGSFFAFDDSGTLLGEFETQRAAIRSIPPAADAATTPRTGSRNRSSRRKKAAAS
jgi:hypothetical protein